MRFRWKLMILLVLIALVPIGAMRIFGIRGVQRLGEELVARSRDNLIASAKNRLMSVVESYSHMLWQAGEQLEVALIAQAREVEHHLVQSSGETTAVYFAEEINAGRKMPRDLDTSTLHFRIISENKMELLRVTRSAQAFNFAPGISYQDVESDINRLAGMTPFYRDQSRYLKEYVLWRYTALENGLYTIYPGYGDFSAGFDPRKQFWYTEAFKRNSFWTDQYVDAQTGQMVIAASKPVKGPDGETAGVTAIIIPVRNLFESRLVLQRLPRQTQSFVVYPEIQPETGKRGARIMVSEDNTDVGDRNWKAPFEADWLLADDDGPFQAVLDDFENSRSNIRRIKYLGCDCLWVYGPMRQQGFFVLITPYEAILKPAIEAEEYIQTQIHSLLTVTNYAIAGILVVIILLALAFSRTVSRPMQKLAEGAQALGAGRFNTRVDIRSRDEFGDMAQVFNSVGPRLEENYLLRQSLDLAMEVQQNLLPKSDPRLPGLDIAGQSDYCEEIGGDYYDYLQEDENQIGLVVGDVSGHGISAALLMSSARAFLRLRASMGGSLPEIVTDVNRQLTEDVEDSGQFMTLFYGRINIREKTFNWVRAGHDAAFFYDRHSDMFEELGGQGLPLGVSEEAVYEELQRRIKPGQIIVIGTDGIWETHNPQGEMFGKDNLQRIIRAQAAQSAREILMAVIEALEDYRDRQKKKEDDITLVVIKVKA
ncbi:MAG: SpoIIE family protein phosphatase [Desulfobacterales bacterium]